MADRKEVMTWLEICGMGDCSECCPYKNGEVRASTCYEQLMTNALSMLKAQKADESKYEYHTDHTDCPWYISGEESKCPVTCSQYRDGWNDAMNYIYRNGDGIITYYMPLPEPPKEE